MFISSMASQELATCIMQFITINCKYLFKIIGF